MNRCEQISETEFKVIISPENEPINPSPWYAFKVWSETKRKISVAITWEFGYSTDRKLIRQAAAVGAAELMRLLLAELTHSKLPPTQASAPSAD